ncbi:hypothetical protein [Streptomyces virginiae]|uniref:hypothetical protein n=1 Tax=Streptomyces virginiae TaxID=1961 RepID=UPI00225BC5F2|nr:hypothetical protein [Streptomyces virginiae]MCX5176744.1 hypothetical protein [Streptomyces virginiae]
MAPITVARPMPEQITPLHLSLDGALLLSLIDPQHLKGPIVEAYEVAGGLITVEDTRNGWLGDFRVTVWVPLSVTAAEDRERESLMDPDLIDPDGRLPLLLGATVADVNAVEAVAAAVRDARTYLIDRSAPAHVRREKAVAEALKAAVLANEGGWTTLAAGYRADADRMRKGIAS